MDTRGFVAKTPNIKIHKVKQEQEESVNRFLRNIISQNEAKYSFDQLINQSATFVTTI